MIGIVPFVNDPAILRDVKLRTHYEYAVDFQSTGTSGEAHSTFNLVIQGEKPREEKKKIPSIFVTLQNYHFEALGLTRDAKSAGFGHFDLDQTGAPQTIGLFGEAGLQWLPLLALTLPDPLADRSFKLDVPLAKEMHLVGKGRRSLSGPDGTKLEWTAQLMHGTDSFGQLVMTVLVDQFGFPKSAAGEFSAKDGKAAFTMAESSKK